MEKEIFEAGEIALKIDGGEIVLIYQGKGGSVRAGIAIDYFLDILKEKIPGTIDDTVIELLKAAIKS